MAMLQRSLISIFFLTNMMMVIGGSVSHSLFVKRRWNAAAFVSAASRVDG
jgi:hypothetical protein